MLEGLEIIIARMETNPDEFIDGDWDYFIEDHVSTELLFTEEEQEAFTEAKKKLEVFRYERRRIWFTQKVITQIMNRDNPQHNYPEVAPRGRIKLSKVDLILAKKSNMTPEQYAKQKETQI